MSAPWEERARLSEEKYERDPSRFTGEPSDFARWVVARLQPRAHVRQLIEVGCGPGRDSRFLVTEGFRVRAIDFAPTAVARALEARALLAEPHRSRFTVVEGEATRYLNGQPSASADAVYAHVVYATLSETELRSLFSAVHRVLRPGGFHAYAVRDRTDPNWGKGVELTRGTYRGGPHEVPYHYFDTKELRAMATPLFERVELFRPRNAHLLYVLDRRAEVEGGGGGT